MKLYTDNIKTMLPTIIAIAFGALIFDSLSGKKTKRKRQITFKKDKTQKKVFVSFAIKDSKYRDFLVSQAKNERSPFTFIDMSVKKPWNENVWKRKCRQKIKESDGMIVLLSNHTWHSSGARWEVKCAKKEGIPVIGMHIKKDNKRAKPTELGRSRVIEWTWVNVQQFIESL